MRTRSNLSVEIINVNSMKLIDEINQTDVSHVALTMEKMGVHFKETCQWIDANVARTAESLVFRNLLWGAGNYIRLASENVDNHVSMLGLCIRGLYEIRLRVELMIEEDSEIGKWQAEAAVDKIELLNGICELNKDDEYSGLRQTLQAEIARMRALLSKHGFKEDKISPVGNIPKKLDGESGKKDRDDEHKALFKLLSKIIHPTSYLINNYNNAADAVVYDVLYVHGQLYAWDIYSRCCDYMKVPSTIQAFESPLHIK